MQKRLYALRDLHGTVYISHTVIGYHLDSHSSMKLCHTMYTRISLYPPQRRVLYCIVLVVSACIAATVHSEVVQMY